MYTDTIGCTLERDRIEHRARRIERAMLALRDRAVYRYSITGTIPLPLRDAISSFERELATLRIRLTELRDLDREALT